MHLTPSLCSWLMYDREGQGCKPLNASSLQRLYALYLPLHARCFHFTPVPLKDVTPGSDVAHPTHQPTNAWVHAEKGIEGLACQRVSAIHDSIAGGGGLSNAPPYRAVSPAHPRYHCRQKLVRAEGSSPSSERQAERERERQHLRIQAFRLRSRCKHACENAPSLAPPESCP